MSRIRSLLHDHAVRLTAIVAILIAYGFVPLPSADESERRDLASRFAFERYELAGAPGAAASERRVRAVHPSMHKISSWISSVGAAVALADLDADGLANDICSVDVVSDRVIIAPAPTTGDRYAAFTLEAEPLPYDRRTMAPMGCVPGDLNEDGRLDLLVYYWGRTPVLFLGTGEPGVPTPDRYRRQELVTPLERWYTNALTRADLDGDGHVDLVVGNYFPDGARVLDDRADSVEQMQDSMSRAANGGFNRLFRLIETTAGDRPSATFESVAVLPEGIARGWSLAVGAADLDGDLLPELYFANDFGTDTLLHNRSRPGEFVFEPLSGRRGFTTARSKVLGHDSFKGMGVDFGDINGDGRQDIFVSNIAAEWALEESHFLWLSQGTDAEAVAAMASGQAPYSDAGETLGVSRSGWGWDTRFADFDNDGVLEVVQATGFVRGRHGRWPELHELAMANDELVRRLGAWPRLQPGDDLSGRDTNPFYVRGEDGRFVDLAAELGLGDPQVTRGIATADVDGDGDLDLALANQWEPSRFYLNQAPDAGGFLALRLLIPVDRRPARTEVFAGPLSEAERPPSRPAIGAEAVVHLPDGRRLAAQVDGGNGHSGVRSSDLHFGLGSGSGSGGAPAGSQQVDVEVSWRAADGTPRSQSLSLQSGWHTVLLGGEAEVEYEVDYEVLAMERLDS